jgi:superoxide dismutase, Cu-Zn family
MGNLGTVIVALLLAGTGAQSMAAQASARKVQLLNSEGQQIGEATVVETQNGVLIRLDLKAKPPGVSPGTHAIHIHEVGQCAAPFKSAGAHFNPSSKKHGFLDPQGQHVGDLPNIHVPENGPLTVEFLVAQDAAAGGKTSLSDADGFSLVIHQGADDYKTDPAGDSGDRIACAAFEGRAKQDTR